MKESSKEVYKALKTMFRVTYALILREAATRHGKLKLGYLWSFIEPIAMISVLLFIFSYRRASSVSNMPQILFFASGLLPFFLYRDIYGRTMNAIIPNIPLLTFPQIHIFDLYMARAFLELFTSIIVFFIFMAIVNFSGLEDVNIDNYLQLLQSVILLFIFGIGCGMISGALILILPSVEVLSHAVIMRPMFFLSGIFFTADMIPVSFRDYMLLNPVFQLVENFRSGFFIQYDSQYIDLQYTVSFVIITLLFGMLFQRAFRKFAFRRI